jgi:hypothetical protein
MPPVVRSARFESGELLTSVEANFFLALDLNDAGILNHDFDRAERNRTHRAGDFTNNTSLVVVDRFACPICDRWCPVPFPLVLKSYWLNGVIAKKI